MIVLVRRAAPARRWRWLAPPLALLAAGLGAALLLAALGHDPMRALQALFVAPLTGDDALPELALKATPLLLCALGIALGCRAEVWNIGAEGQFTLGAICAGGVALGWGDAAGAADGAWVPTAAVLAGIAGGLAWAAIPALLRTRFNAHEILTTLMLAYVAAELLGWLVHGPWRDPDGFSFPQSRQFPPAAMLAPLVDGTRLYIGTPLGVALVPVAAFVLGRTMLGFRVRVSGLAPEAARYAGFSRNGTIWLCLLTSGALAGLAGALEVLGPDGQLTPTISPGYGFAAIIVAFLGRLDPWGILAASVLMAVLYLGGENLQVAMQVPTAVTGVLQALLLLVLLGADLLIDYRVAWRERGGQHA